MAELFLCFLNMSISASYVVLAVLLLRLLLRRAPKWIAVLLWGMVGVRLICPVSLESVLSLIPSAETVSPGIMTEQTPQINTGIPIVNQVINPVISGSFSPDPSASANPLQIWIPVLAAIWLCGVLAMLLYTAVSYLRVRCRVRTAVLCRDNLYQSESVVSPFVLGVLRPRIYLPFRMEARDVEHVIAHEQAHIRRKDHWWKPIGFLLLSLHWFNPLMWLGYVLLCRDIELACDERVIKGLDVNARADYSAALLACSINRRMIAACPLAFGEVDVKARVRSVLHYRRPAFWIILVAILVSVAAAVCLLTDPKAPSSDPPVAEEPDAELAALRERFPAYFDLDAENGLDVFVWQMNAHSYSFGLLPRVNPDAVREEDTLLRLPSANAAEMRRILSTYDVDPSEIRVIPWQNPLSSYIPYIWVIDPDLPQAAVSVHMQTYIVCVREMLFGSTSDGPPQTVLPLEPLITEIRVAYAGWQTEAFRGALNEGEENRPLQLPIHRIDSSAALADFTARFGTTHGYDEIPSFIEQTQDMDEAFFRAHSVLAVYVGPTSSTYRFGVSGISIEENSLCLQVTTINDPHGVADDIEGWWLLTLMQKEALGGIEHFDAVFVEKEPAYTITP